MGLAERSSDRILKSFLGEIRGTPPRIARGFDNTVLHDYSYDFFHPGLFEKFVFRI